MSNYVEYNDKIAFDYSYFKKNFGLLDLPRKIDEQIDCLRKFLQVAALTVFKKRDMAVSFKNCGEDMNDNNIIKANIMVQIAINKARTIEAPKFNRSKFEDAADKYAADKLIPPEEYQTFVQTGRFDVDSIRRLIIGS